MQTIKECFEPTSLLLQSVNLQENCAGLLEQERKFHKAHASMQMLMKLFLRKTETGGNALSAASNLHFEY